MADIYNEEQYRIVITFGNNKTYELDTSLVYSDRALNRINTNEDESVNSGNPIGIITSNSLSLSILDSSDRLSIINKNGPFYGYIRNGVKIDLYVKYDSGESLYGTYYVTDWDTPSKAGSGEPTEITAKDRVNYIGNKEIPKLPAYSGVSIQELIKNVFSAIGIQTSEYYIDPSLDINMLFGITVGTKVRDFLNQVAQALLARVILGRDNVIRIVPALKSYGEIFTLDDNHFSDLTASHNSSIIYNKVRIHFNKLGTSELGILAQLDGLIAKPGENKINNLRFNGKSISVHQVYINSPELVNNIVVDIGNISWKAYQDGIDITFSNNNTFDINGITLVIEGKIINTTESSEEADISGADTEVANILEIKNDIIQTSEQALLAANNMSEYLKKMNKVLVLGTQLTLKATVGDRLVLNSSDSNYDGTYKIISCRTSMAPTTYNKTITLIYEEDMDKAVWDDKLFWVDTLIWDDIRGFISKGV